MKRLNSPAIIAIIVALFIYIGVIVFMYGVSVHNGRKIEQEYTRNQMNEVAWNVEQLLFTMSDNATSYISSFGQVERDAKTWMTRLILTPQDYTHLQSKQFASSLVHFVNSAFYMPSAFFYFEPGVIGEDSYQPFYHQEDDALQSADTYFNFSESALYHQVQHLHHNWWHIADHLSIFGEPIMACCTPIYLEDTCHFIGAFVMDYSLTFLNEFINESKPYRDAELFVVGSDEHIIASTDSMYFGYLVDEVPGWNPQFFGNDEVVFPHLPWRLRMYTPKEEIRATLLAFLDQFLLYGFVGLLLLATCLFLAIRSINKAQRKQHAIEHELQMAGMIQRSLLPATLPQCKEVQVAAFLRPAKEVAGDIYEVQVHGDYRYFMVGDVSGKGLQASMVMAMMNGLFRHLIYYCKSPAVIMSSLNQSLVERNPESLFCTMLIGRLYIGSGELLLCNAGHNLPIIRGQKVALQSHIALGIIEHYTYQDETFWMQPNDTLLCYTDGVTEAMNPQQQLFGEERLLAIPSSIETILKEVDTFVQGYPQSDDMTLLTLTYTPWTMCSINDTEALRKHLQMRGITDPKLSSAQLAIEEIAVNALTHGHASWITIFTQLEHDDIHVTLVDNGQAFDAIEASKKMETVTPTSLEDLSVGGQGLLIFHQLAHTAQYTYVNALNILTFTI